MTTDEWSKSNAHLCNLRNKELQRIEMEERHVSTAHLDIGGAKIKEESTDVAQDRLKANMDAIREEVKDFFCRCREMLENREQALLQQISEDMRQVQYPHVSKRRKSLKNHAHQLKANPLGSIEEGSGSDEGGTRVRSNKEEEKQNGSRDDNATDTPLNAKETLRKKRGRKLKAGHADAKDENNFSHTFGSTQFHLSRAGKKEMKQFENAVQNLGIIYVGNADPSKTIAVARPALVCVKCTAKVKAIDNAGKECKRGGDSLTATLQAPGEETLPCEILDNDNGTYTISFRPKTAGTHHLHVCVSGQPIKSSPLHVRVQPVRLQAKSSFVGGPCMFGLEIPIKYKVHVPCDTSEVGESEMVRLIPDMMNIVVKDQDNKRVESSVIGCVCNDKEISTYNVRFLPVSPGDHEIQVCLKDSDSILAQQVIPVHEREQVGRSGNGPGEFFSPTDLAISPHGDIFVADTVENSRIQRFTSDGTFASQFMVDLREPALIGVDAVHIGAVFLGSKQVVLYTYDGHPVHQFAHDQMTHPAGIALNSQGSIYVIDLALHCLLIFTKVGKLITRLGQEGTRPGEFNHPHFLTIGSDDHVYVSEARNCRVQELNKVGAYIKDLRSKDKLAEPGSLAVTSGGHLLVHDERSRKVQIINLDENRFAGNLPLDLIQPHTGRIVVTTDGYIIVLDMFNHCLWRYRAPFEP